MILNKPSLWETVCKMNRQTWQPLYSIPIGTLSILGHKRRDPVLIAQLPAEKAKLGQRLIIAFSWRIKQYYLLVKLFKPFYTKQAI